jgi:hypothetical protein
MALEGSRGEKVGAVGLMDHLGICPLGGRGGPGSSGNQTFEVQATPSITQGLWRQFSLKLYLKQMLPYP